MKTTRIMGTGDLVRIGGDNIDAYRNRFKTGLVVKFRDWRRGKQALVIWQTKQSWHYLDQLEVLSESR